MTRVEALVSRSASEAITFQVAVEEVNSKRKGGIGKNLLG